MDKCLKQFVTFIYFGFLFFMVSCAQNRKVSNSNELSGEKNIESRKLIESKSSKKSRVISGSARIHKGTRHKNGTFFLYGAEHLKLEQYYFDIPVKYNRQVRKWIRYFTGRGRKAFIRYSNRAGRYAPVMAKILEEYSLPKDLIFLAMAESGFRNNAKSWAKAVGPWQFMPFTGRKFGLEINWYLDERRDPIKSSVAAAKYLKYLYKMFGNWELAAAGYNAGEGKVSRAIRKYKTQNFWDLTKGRYLRPETKNYVPKIMALAIIGKNLSSFGFENISFQKTLDFEVVTVPGGSDLYKLSDSIGVSFDKLRKLNPELLRWVTPPDKINYSLKVPVGVTKDWQQCCAQSLAQFRAVDYQRYRVRGKRSTLADVAKKFKLKAYVLEKLNKKRKWQRLKRREKVLLPFRLGQSKRDPMYADLYEKPRRSVVRRKQYKKHVLMAIKKGRKISNPTEWYVVKKGDTLWNVARKNNVSLYTLIHTNIDLINKRMIRAGDRLAVR